MTDASDFGIGCYVCQIFTDLRRTNRAPHPIHEHANHRRTTPLVDNKKGSLRDLLNFDQVRLSSVRRPITRTSPTATTADCRKYDDGQMAMQDFLRLDIEHEDNDTFSRLCSALTDDTLDGTTDTPISQFKTT